MQLTRGQSTRNVALISNEQNLRAKLQTALQPGTDRSKVQTEITARTDLTDLRYHAKSWDLLRMTKMPAVRVECGYISSPHDARRLADPAFRDAVAEGIAAAVVRFFAPVPAEVVLEAPPVPSPA